MIKLKEIFHTLEQENQEGLTEIDDWKITDYDFLIDMGFKQDGIYYLSMDKPHIKICHKKGSGFILNDKSKNETHTFSTFKELTEFFMKYEQKWDREPYKS